MAEIIFAETTENRAALDSDIARSRVFLDNKVTIFQDHRKVSMVTSTLASGVPRTAPDKRWYQWRTYEACGFYRTSTGLAQPFHCVKPVNHRAATKWKNIPPTKAIETLGPVDDITDLGEAFRKAMWETFRIKNFNDLFPMAAFWDIDRYIGLPGNIRKAFRHRDKHDFAVEVFGQKRYNKELYNAVFATDPYIVAVANEFRGYASDKAITRFMADNKFDEEMEEGFDPHTPYLRKAILPHIPMECCDSMLSRGFDLSDIRRLTTLSNIRGAQWTELIEKRLSGKEPASITDMYDAIYGGRLVLT